ncbi:TIGR02452 family protein [bacterium SCSIO 12741]|nr:TIGR02452 family protein [bacterium SCSIO 12741]
MNREIRKTKAQETLKILEKGGYSLNPETAIDFSSELKRSINKSQLFSPDELSDVSHSLEFDKSWDMQTEIVHEDTLSCILRLKEEGNARILCLNFASARNPGGGFLNGSLAQEESLAVSTGLYLTQLKHFDFYEYHRNQKTCFYSDRIIYSPNVPIFRDTNGDLLPAFKLCSLITSAAVNKGVIQHKEMDRLNEVVPTMKRRIDRILSLAYLKGYDTLILGAWGCGVFQNDPDDIAALFAELLNTKFKGRVKKIVFAIYSRSPRFIQAFKSHLTDNDEK